MFCNSKFNQYISVWVLSLDDSVYMKKFNKKSEHEKMYGEINCYIDFIKSVDWDRVKPYIKDIVEHNSDSDRYKLLKKLSELQPRDIDLDLNIDDVDNSDISI